MQPLAGIPTLRPSLCGAYYLSMCLGDVNCKISLEGVMHFGLMIDWQHGTQRLPQ
jgi:hypothetical protein